MGRVRLFKNVKLLCNLIAVLFLITTSGIAAEKSIKIGVLLARTGPLASLATYCLDGFNLYMEQAGYKVDGRKIELVYEDEGPGDPAFSMDKIRKLVESDKVDIVVGPFNSDLRLGVLAYTSKKRIPNFAIAADDEGSLKFPYQYAFIQTTYQEVRPLGWYVFDKLNVRTVTTIGGDWHAGRAFIDGFVQGFTKERKGKVVQQQFIPLGTTDFSSYIVSMKKADALAIVSVPSDAAAFLSQAHQMGALNNLKVLVIGESLIPPMLKDLGPKLIGKTWHSAEMAAGNKRSENQKFIKMFEKKYGYPPGSLQGSGYTVAQVITEALKITKGNAIDPDKFHEAVKSLKLETTMGYLTFTNGKPDKSGVEGILSRFMEELKKGKDGYYWELVHEYKDVKPVR